MQISIFHRIGIVCQCRRGKAEEAVSVCAEAGAEPKDERFMDVAIKYGHPALRLGAMIDCLPSAQPCG